jgi:propionyl-CoA carboxylase alpha chain
VAPIRKLLITNRGEIAVRVRRTATEMGMRCVGVYTAEERESPHVFGTDEAVLLDGTGAAAYLDAEALIEVARRTGADAVHPGYGFLAENPAFARAVTEAGLIWVGPQADSIARMGDKLEAKRIAFQAGVPTLEEMEPSNVRFPALIKATAGGGGKGMRIVRDPDELDDAIAAAQREAERAFGDARVFIEPYLDGSRHVEFQVLGDGHGNIVHLFERECSIQRRHQKVVEEAPSVAVTEELRERMGEAALTLARAIGYRNAGTVEFLLAEDESFYFLEMNTRLQVEHPVTEEITGVDIVRQQFLDAAGDSLEVIQDELDIDGHALEVRLNAEDPSNDFLPATGTLSCWRPDYEVPVRYESGIDEGTVVGTSFDPLLAKVIAHAPTRAEAADMLARALEWTAIQGVKTNRDLLVSLLRDFEFLEGRTTTDFLERVALEPRRTLSSEERTAVLAAVALAGAEKERSEARVLTSWPSGWRNSIMPPQRRIYVLGGEEMTVSYRRVRSGEVLLDAGAGERVVWLGGEADDIERTIEVGGQATHVTVDQSGTSWWVHGSWGDVEVVERSPFPSSEVEEVSGSLHAPMPGSVVSVEVAVGDAVRRGQTLVVLEAMKMEHPIGCPEDGVVSEVRVSAGEQVERGALLVVVEGAG